MERVDIAADVHVGTPPEPPGPLSNWVTRKVHFHGFAGLPTTRGEAGSSPEFSCFGHQWTLEIMPGGGDTSEEGYASLFLCNESPESIQAYYKILLKHPTDQTQRAFGVGDSMRTGLSENAWGTFNFAKRETVLTYLNNGTLTIEVHLRTHKQPEEPTITIFVPSNPFNGNMLEGFDNEEMSDVAFEVSGQLVFETSNTTFHAFHAVLGLNAPSLADMCRPGDEAAVPINGVEPEVFKMVLYFCYGGEIEEEELSANAKAII